MGYTHYWEIRDPEAWAAAFPLIVHDAFIIISHSGVPIGGPLIERSGSLAPTVSEIDGIALNGNEDNCHEPFVLVPDVRNLPMDAKGRPKYRRFCKTARKPYDMVVTAILIRAKLHAGDALSVTSDGSWSEWHYARGFLEGLWGEEGLVCPFDREESEEDDDTESDGTEIDDRGEGFESDFADFPHLPSPPPTMLENNL